MSSHLADSGTRAEDAQLLHQPRSIVRERQDPHSRNHAASRIPTPVVIPTVTVIPPPSSPPPSSPPPLRRRVSNVWRRNDYNLPPMVLDCIKTFAAKFRGFPHGVRTVSGRKDLSDIVLQECKLRAVTAFAFLNDVGDANCWWRENAGSSHVQQALSASSDLLDDLQWRLLDSNEFNFRRLRSLRYPILKWKIGCWIERYNIQFYRAELFRLAEFLNNVQTNGTAQTFVGYIPSIDNARRPNEALAHDEVEDHGLQKRKKVKIRIGWNLVVRAWIRITNSGVNGAQEKELDYFMFPGKLRAIPPRHLSGPWTIGKVGFLINLKQLVEKRPLKHQEDRIYAGMHDAIQEQNLRALELLLTFLPPEWHHFTHAMTQANLKIFKLLFMYGGQYLPEQDPHLISWAECLKVNPSSSSRRRLLGSWLLDYLKSQTARQRSLNPLFIDGNLHDVQAWRADERFRKVFSDMCLNCVDPENVNTDANQARPSNLDNGDQSLPNSSGDHTGSHETHGESGNTTGALGQPSDSSTSAGIVHSQTTDNDIRDISARRDIDDGHRADEVFTLSDGPVEHAPANGYYVREGARPYIEVTDRPSAATAIADHVISPVDGAMASRLESAEQRDREFVAVWADGYNADDEGDWDPGVPSLRLIATQW